ENLGPKDPDREANRVRLTALLRQSPRLLGMLFHDPRIDHLEFQATGRRLLTVSQGRAYLWDTDSGKLIRSFPSRKSAVAQAWFSLDGQSVLTRPAQGTATQKWDAVTGQLVDAIPPAKGFLPGGLVSRDGRYVIGLAQHGGQTEVREMATGKTVF